MHGDLVVQHRNAACIFLIVKDRPGFILLEIFVNEVWTIGDARIAPIGGSHHHLPVDHHALGRLQRREDILPVGKFGRIDWRRELRLDESADRIIARMHDICRKSAADLL